jgi:integrase
MAGQIIQRGDRTWLVRVYLGRDHNGKKKYHNKTVKGAKREAEKYRNKVLAEHQAGSFVEPTKISVGAYLERWLNNSARLRVAERTFLDYTSHVTRYLSPVIGHRKLAQLQPAEIQRVYSDMLQRGLSPRTVRYVHSTLRSALQQAVLWGEIPRNPASLVQLPRNERKEQAVLAAAEINRLIEASRGTRWSCLWILLAMSGLRPGEALGLKWTDLDGDRLRIQRSLVRVRGSWSLKKPKTDRSRRSVVLPKALLRELKEYRARQAAEKLAAGSRYGNLGLIFANKEGAPLDYRTTARRYFRPLLKAAGLPEIRPYDLRHSHATLMLGGGVHPKIVSERLGHSSTVMTMDVYSHVLPNMQQAAVEQLEALLANAG